MMKALKLAAAPLYDAQSLPFPARRGYPTEPWPAPNTPGEAAGVQRGRSSSQSLLLSTVPALSFWPALTVLATTHITGNLNMSSTHTDIHDIYIFFNKHRVITIKYSSIFVTLRN